MLDLCLSTKFKKDLKKIRKQGKEVSKLDEVVGMLQSEKPLPGQFRDHDLIGNWRGYRECHITPDWLLIYKKTQSGTLRLLELVRTGSHSDLFK